LNTNEIVAPKGKYKKVRNTQVF